MKRSTLSILVLFVVPALAATTTFAQAEGGQATAALERFIEAWNSGDNTQLRTAMNFPFLSFSAARLQLAEQPHDFAVDFAGMRERNDWVRSACERARTGT